MDFLRRFFRKDEHMVQCPRCLGKGKVDWNDIKRLNKELKWAPGSCAYCNGKGKVDPGILVKVAVDESFLTTDISWEDRLKLIRQDPETLQKAKAHDENLDNYFKQIMHLYNNGKMDADQIATFYLAPEPSYPDRDFLMQKQELIDFIKRVIDKLQ